MTSASCRDEMLSLSPFFNLHKGFPCDSGGKESAETERKPEVPAFPRGEALFSCARPSGVPRGPATSTGSYSPWGLKELDMTEAT